MTWVIGGIKPNYVFLISDLRIALNGKPLNQFGVQKVQQVGLHLVAGFANDVHIGLDLLAFMRAWVQERVAASASVSADALVEAVMDLWTDTADQYSAAERADGVELFIAGWPTRYFPGLTPTIWMLQLFHDGITARSEVLELTMGEVGSIGIGADLDDLVQDLYEQIDDNNIVSVLNSYQDLRKTRPDLPETVLHLGPGGGMPELATLTDAWVLLCAHSLQERIDSNGAAVGRVGSMLVSTVVDSLGCRSNTLNPPDSLPPMASNWEQVQDWLQRVFDD